MCNQDKNCYETFIDVIESQHKLKKGQKWADRILTAFLRCSSHSREVEIDFVKLYLYLTKESLSRMPGQSVSRLPENEKRRAYSILQDEVHYKKFN